jgi:hypothetical protein
MACNGRKPLRTISQSKEPAVQSPAHASDFAQYTTDRRQSLRNIRQLHCYLRQLETVVAAMPDKAENASYLDLDNIQQINGDVADAVEAICDWDSLALEMSRFGV